MRRRRRRRQTSRQVHFMYDEDRDLFDAMLAHANAHPEATMVDTLNEFASREDADIMAKIIYSVNPADFTQTLEKQWQKSFVEGFWDGSKAELNQRPPLPKFAVALFKSSKKPALGRAALLGVFAICFLESVAFWIKVNKEVTQVNSKTREKKKVLPSLA
ncbi:hypothetical protein BDR26DRAFT_875109, partial [Obelidium mucronatum]